MAFEHGLHLLDGRAGGDERDYVMTHCQSVLHKMGLNLFYL